MSSNDDQFDDGLENFDEVAVDEFGNDIVPGEENFAEEEDDWESYDEQDEDSGDDQPPPRAGKKSGNFNRILIGVAVLVGAGVLVLQLGRSPTPTPAPVPAPVVTAPIPAAPPVPTGAPANPDAPQGGFLTNPENMAALEQDIAKTYGDTEIAVFDESRAEIVAPADNVAAPPMPTAITQQEPPTSAPTLVADSPPPVPAGLDDLASTASPDTNPVGPAIRMPSASDVLLKQPVAEVAITEEVPTAALLEKLDLVLARLDRLESDVKMLKERDESAAVAAVDDLKESLAVLEKKVAAGGKTTATAPKMPTVEASQPKPQILGSSAPEPAPKPSPAATPRKTDIQWVLKGAQPGRAMVSQPGENEMRTVVVGDTLPGIGRITGISYQDGRWLVQGTQGRITQ
jgi:hypothetical protein